MAFGDSMKMAANASATANSTDSFMNIWTDPQRGVYRTGRRVFRILPVYANGKLVVPNEVSFAEYWIPIMRKGVQKQQRVMVDFGNRFRNPIWERLYEAMPKEVNGKPNRNRKLANQRFAMNVLDKTKVIKLPDGRYAYPSENGQYYVDSNGVASKLEGTPTQLNQVRILEGSTGKPGGKHMLRGLGDLVGSVTHPEDDERVLQLYEFDIVLKVSGEGTDTMRSFNLGGNVQSLTEEYINLPRFDLESWVKPWPHSIINALLDGEDFDEVMQGSGIVLIPQIIKDSTGEEVEEEVFQD